MSDGPQYVDSWVTLDRAMCYQLMRTEHPELFDPWISAWSDLVELDITPVQTSAQASAAVGQAPRWLED